MRNPPAQMAGRRADCCGGSCARPVPCQCRSPLRSARWRRSAQRVKPSCRFRPCADELPIISDSGNSSGSTSSVCSMSAALGALHRFQHAVEVERLGDVVERAAARRRHYGFHGAAGGHENHGARRILAARRFQHVQARSAVNVDIRNNDRILVLVQAGQGLIAWTTTASTA